jgi:hypothetical protein
MDVDALSAALRVGAIEFVVSHHSSVSARRHVRRWVRGEGAGISATFGASSHSNKVAYAAIDAAVLSARTGVLQCACEMHGTVPESHSAHRLFIQISSILIG